jgi:hypothetical protein
MPDATARSPRRNSIRRGAAVIGILLGAFVVSVWGGTILQSRLTGDILGPCSRALDNDNSTFQQGHASVHWFPPRIHCAFDADAFFGRKASSTDESAVGGMVLVGAAVALVLFLLLLIWVNLPKD